MGVTYVTTVSICEIGDHIKISSKDSILITINISGGRLKKLFSLIRFIRTVDVNYLKVLFL